MINSSNDSSSNADPLQGTWEDLFYERVEYDCPYTRVKERTTILIYLHIKLYKTHFIAVIQENIFITIQFMIKYKTLIRVQEKL